MFFVGNHRPTMGMVAAVAHAWMVMYNDKSPRPQPIESATGSYDAVWWTSVALGVLAAALHIPIAERRAPVLAPA